MWEKENYPLFYEHAESGNEHVRRGGDNCMVVCAVKIQCEPYMQFPVVCENHFLYVVVSSPFDHFLS